MPILVMRRTVNHSVRFLKTSIRSFSEVRIGLGSYKWKQMSTETYDEVVRVALCNGISTFEAASMPGGDIALANAYRKAVSKHPEVADRRVEIFQRIGYRENSDETFPNDIPQPNSAVKHNISPLYIQSVLQESDLTKLCQEFPSSVDLTPMLHNPEAQGDGTLDSRWVVHDAMVSAFTALEDWIEGWQDSVFVTRYGVVSNGLNLAASDEDHPMALPAEILLNAVDRATTSRGLREHNTHFEAIQLPVNLLEKGDLCKELRDSFPASTQLYGMRPLNCYPDGGMGRERPWLLADYLLEDGKWTNDMETPPPKYDIALKSLLGHLDAEDLEETDTKGETLEAARFLQSLIQDLDACLSSVRSLQEYHDVLTQHIEPLAQIDAMDDETANLMGNFFHHHGQAARYAVASRTREQLVASSMDVPTKARLQELGIWHSLNCTDTVVLNCSSVEHVLDAVKTSVRKQE